MNMISAERTRTLDWWLGATMKAARTAAHITRTQIAGRLGVAELTVLKFEHGESHPRESDQYLAAYAELLGVADALVFYERAIARWRADGRDSLPRVETERPTRAADAARRVRRDPSARDDGSPPTPATNARFPGQSD